MKRIIILAIIGLCISGASMAQGQKLKGRLIDKDHYPVKNAKVTVKGTTLSTTSDRMVIFSLKMYRCTLILFRWRKAGKTSLLTHL